MFAKAFLITGLALLLWTVVPRPSGAHGHKVTYRVRAYDTLWTIAAAANEERARGAACRRRAPRGTEEDEVEVHAPRS